MATITVKLPNGEMQPMSYPDDWTDDQIKGAISKHFPDAGGQSEQGGHKPMELELTQGQNRPERTGFRGLASDTIHMLGNALKGGVGFVRRAPGNIAEIGSELIHHPLSYPVHAAGQVLAGLGEGAKGLANLPHELVEELGRKEIIPSWVHTGSIPEDTGVEKFLGLEPTKKSDEVLRALPALYGGGKLLTSGVKAGRKLTQAPDLRKALKQTQAKVNAMDEGFGKTLDKIETQVEERGINKIPISKTLISDAKSLLDKSPETKKMIADAEKGDYKALRALQADLRTIGENALSNKLSTERNVGRQAMSVRDRINKGIEEHFEATGNKDLAEDLNATRSGYRELKDIYFSTPALAKAFGKSQRIPKNPLTLLTEDSAEMKKFFEAHPEMKEITDKFLKHKGKMKALKWVLGMLGTGATGGVTYKALDH